MPAHDPGDLALIEQAARDGGVIARHFFGGDYKRWDKGKGQPVTEADLAIDRQLRRTLTGARPDYGWLSEESDNDPARRDAEYAFIVDPIDGTTAFLKGRPHFSISIAIVRDGRPETGVVYNPITEECFTAAKGAGARLNGAPIHTTNCCAIAGCRMIAAKRHVRPSRVGHRAQRAVAGDAYRTAKLDRLSDGAGSGRPVRCNARAVGQARLGHGRGRSDRARKRAGASLRMTAQSCATMARCRFSDR